MEGDLLATLDRHPGERAKPGDDAEGRSAPVPEEQPPADGWGRSRPATVVAWALFALMALGVTVSVLSYDFRTEPVIGDQASFLVNAQSLAHGDHNLSYDRADFERFLDVGWADQPYGLFFQRYRYGWSFAKPYGYSVWLVPFLRVLGARWGMPVANLALMAAITVLGATLLRLRFRGAVVPLTLGAYLFGSYLFFYAYHFYVELFVVALVSVVFLALVKGVREERPGWVTAGVAISAFLVAEKAPALVLVGPACAYAVARLGSWRLRVQSIVVAGLVLAVAVAPYLYYSDGRTWSAYGGERYYAAGGAPFGGSDAYERFRLGDSFSVGYVRDQAFRDIPDKARSAVYYVAGRHTGVLVFMPLAVFLVAATLIDRRRGSGLGWVVLVGLGAYVLFYVWLFPGNYYGGGQSFGNRYFLQASPAVLALPVVFRLRARALAIAGAASILVALVFLWPHYERPSSALRDLWRTSPVQRVLPFESNQERASFFRRP